MQKANPITKIDGPLMLNVLQPPVPILPGKVMPLTILFMRTRYKPISESKSPHINKAYNGKGLSCG